MSQTITIQLDPPAVQFFRNSGQQIGLGGVGDSQTVVCCLAFSPSEQNRIQLASGYGIYASFTRPEPGETIDVASQTEFPAQQGSEYLYQDGFLSQQGGGQPGYSVVNQSGGPSSFGLLVSTTFDGPPTTSPTTIVEIPSDQPFGLQPPQTMAVFVTGDGRGTILSSLPQGSFQFPATQPSVTLGFNAETQSFYGMG